jgi:flagellar protein FliS
LYLYSGSRIADKACEEFRLNFFDPYQVYVEGSVFSGNPLSTVVALYEGTLDSIRQARRCFESADIAGRGKAINKGVTLLTELIVSLDYEKGGEIAINLKRLYSYIQCRLVDAHTQKSEAPLLEAEKLLGTMLEGWREAVDKLEAEAQEAKHAGYSEDGQESAGFAYGFFNETPEFAGGISATF